MDAESQPTDDEFTTTEENPGQTNPNSVLLIIVGLLRYRHLLAILGHKRLVWRKQG